MLNIKRLNCGMRLLPMFHLKQKISEVHFFLKIELQFESYSQNFIDTQGLKIQRTGSSMFFSKIIGR